jgi:hypothetical protein
MVSVIGKATTPATDIREMEGDVSVMLAGVMLIELAPTSNIMEAIDWVVTGPVTVVV